MPTSLRGLTLTPHPHANYCTNSTLTLTVRFPLPIPPIRTDGLGRGTVFPLLVAAVGAVGTSVADPIGPNASAVAARELPVGAFARLYVREKNLANCRYTIVSKRALSRP